MEVQHVTTDVDLSKLIDFSVTFQPLQLTMQNILQRLEALEKDKVEKNEEIKRLNDLLHAEASRGKEVPTGGADHSDLLDEINQIKKTLDQIQTVEEQQRLSIDELYEARKQRRGSRPSVSYSQVPRLSSHEVSAGTSAPPPREPTPEALYASAEELPLGDKILSLAHEDLDGVPPLDHTRRYTNEATASSPTTPTTVEERNPSGEVVEQPASREQEDKASTRNPSLTHGETPSGEHDGRPVSASHATQSDIFAVKPLETQTGSRAASPRGDRRTYSVSLMDKVKRDGDDIAYLNRVVAEILGEMKSLHNDLDLLRLMNSANTPSSEAKPVEAPATEARTPPPSASSGEVSALGQRLGDLSSRLAQLEETLEVVNHSSEFRDKGLQDEVDALRQQLQAAGRLTEEEVDRVKGLTRWEDRLGKLEGKVDANETAQEALSEKLNHVLESLNSVEGKEGDSGVHPAQFGMLQGSVSALERQLADLQNKEEKDWTADIERLGTAVKELREETGNLGQHARRLDTECERLEDAKENKGVGARSPSIGGGNTANLEELVQRLNTLSVSHDTLSNTVREKTNFLEESKADRAALQRLRDELHNIKKLIELNGQRDTAATGEGEGEAKLSSGTEQLILELQRQLLEQSENASANGGVTQEEVSRLREMIQQLDYRKADATLVANKAERDYVENALERLMREVEQVLNATNAGLIDTLDKSLNILRDMIDGKATKQDIQRLQQLSLREGQGGAPDGLTGFKGYRCLGCNRPMDNLRPRSLPSKMNTFLNRNPQNYPQDNVTRSIQQQQAGTALLEQRAASYNSGKMGRSGTPPLPPIEGPH